MSFCTCMGGTGDKAWMSCLPERMRANSSGLMSWTLLQPEVSAAAVLPSVQRAPQAEPRARPQPLGRRSDRRPSQPMQRGVQPCAALTPMTYLLNKASIPVHSPTQKSRGTQQFPHAAHA